MNRQRLVLGFVFVFLMVSLTVLAGPISIAPQGHYFQKDNEAFLIIGPNDAITWPGLSPLLGRASYGAVEDYVARMRENGINTVRIMLEYAQTSAGLLENPIGHYRSEVVQFWDDLFPLFEKYGIYVIITPWDPFWMQSNWSENPYNIDNGGILSSMHGFLANEAALEAQKERLCFAVRRWGGSKQILAWELMNEIDLWWGASPQEIYNWIDMMADLVRSEQKEAYGFTSLVTVSTASPTPSGTLGEVIYNHPKLDFASTHLYTGPGMNAPFNTTDAADEVALAVNYATWRIRDNRPYTDTESGPIEMWIGSARFDAEYLHNVSWAHLANGGAGTGMRWPYRTPHILTDDMMRVLGRIGVFVEEFNFTGFAPRSMNPDLESEPDHLVYGLSDGKRAFVWLLREAHAQGALRSSTISLENVVPGNYEVAYWNTWEGEWIERSIESLIENNTLTTPPFSKDIVLVLTRYE